MTRSVIFERRRRRRRRHRPSRQQRTHVTLLPRLVPLAARPPPPRYRPTASIRHRSRRHNRRDTAAGLPMRAELTHAHPHPQCGNGIILSSCVPPWPGPSCSILYENIRLVKWHYALINNIFENVYSYLSFSLSLSLRAYIMISRLYCACTNDILPVH